MKIVIIGANGQLGSDLVKIFKDTEHEIFPLSHTDIDITDFKLSKNILDNIKPDIVIDCAAYIRVDDAEDFPEKAFLINAIGTRNVANLCKELESALIYISTDYIFDGTKKEPYTEEDIPNPLNVYGNSKLAGEYFVRNILEKYYIIRSSSLFGIAGSSGKGGNFVETMIKKAKNNEEIRVVDDMIMSPTYTKDLANAIKIILKKKLPFDTYNMTNRGECSWYEFTKTIFEILEIKVNLFPINIGKQKAKRPKYSSLSNSKLQRYGIEIEDWNVALNNYLIEKRYI